MKKYYLVADVHGFYDELKRALDEKGFDINNPMHIFVSLGDLLDRGKKPLECLKFVNSIPDNRKILIRGNHENLLEECLVRKEFLYHDYHNGTEQTVLDLGNSQFVDRLEDVFEIAKNDPEWLKYKNSLVDYYEDKKNIFVHGWIPCERNDLNIYHAKNVNYWYDPGWRVGNWYNACWVNGMDAWSQGVREPNKTIYCGHWHSSWGHSKLHKLGPEFDNPYSTNPEYRKACFDPFIDEGIVALDTCTAYSHKVNCYVVEVPDE